MKEYCVCITETLIKNVVVQAKNEQEAWEKVNEMYKKEEIILSDEDFDNVEIEVF